jgi:hypothetical protein
MTRIIIEDVRDAADLLVALDLLLESMRDDVFALEEYALLRNPSYDVHPGQLELDLGIGDVPPAEPWTACLPVPYVPCPGRRAHTRLTDCWLCWSDVKRGAAHEADVLASAAPAAA